MVGFHPLFGIRSTTAGDVVTVSVLGEVDLATVGRLREALSDPPSDIRLLVCDLTPVSFLGCCGLTALVEAHEALTHLGVQFEIVATNRAVLRPLRLSGLLEKLPIRPPVSIVDDPCECARPHDDGKVGG